MSSWFKIQIKCQKVTAHFISFTEIEITMSRNFQTHYQALSTVYDEDDEEQEEAPADNIIQIIPDHSKCNHFSHFEGIAFYAY